MWFKNTAFQAAVDHAKAESDREDCSQHVNAHVELVEGVPTITGFQVSDWFVDGCTLMSFQSGRECN